MTVTTPEHLHPRPDHRRDGWWQLLDGMWDFSTDITSSPDSAANWRRIVVPAPWESQYSQIGANWTDRACYRRSIELPAVGNDQLVLHFQAVHYRAQVFIDGTQRAEHVGGQSPFTVDLTDVAGRRVELAVLVYAPVDKRDIPHGKQRSMPADPYDSCSFTPCSGIWQSVWLERRPSTHIRTARLIAADTLDAFSVAVAVDGDQDGCRIRVDVAGSGETAELLDGFGRLMLNRPHLWTPEDPHLYRIGVSVWRGTTLLDRITCTTGLRTIIIDGPHLKLNGRRTYLRGVLDQGYWPSSGWTAPSVADFERDLRSAKAAGFNLVRKHLKLEDPRWLHLADRIGMLVWEEPPSLGRYTHDGCAAFEDQLLPMIERDANHPSIVIWGIYNEEWGLDWDVADHPDKARVIERAYHQVTTADPTRPVVDNSGWSHVRTDLVDWHVYSPDLTTWRSVLAGLASGFNVNLGAGGIQHKQLMADGSTTSGRAIMNSEYGTGNTSIERAWTMRWQTQELRRLDEANGYIYCELYDIEHETAGVLTSHRVGKDDAHQASGDVHSETVIVVDIIPVAPACDLIVKDERVSFSVRFSSHASDPQEVKLRVAWGEALSRDAAPQAPVTTLSQHRIVPYILSEPLYVQTILPEGHTHGRLHLWAETVGDENRIAHAVVDVRLAEPLTV